MQNLEHQKKELIEIENNKKILLEKLPQELKELFYFFKIAATWRDNRKKMHQIGAFLFKNLPTRYLR